jgi:hypothetical protein
MNKMCNRFYNLTIRNSCTGEIFRLKRQRFIFNLFICPFFLRVIVDIEFSIPLIGGAYIGAVSLVVMIYSIRLGYIARLSQWEGGAPLPRQIVFLSAFAAATGKRCSTL